MLKNLMLTVSLLLPLECYAGKVTYGIHTLSTEDNDKEVNCSRRATCKNVGTRMVVTYEKQNPVTHQDELLWRAEISFKPRSLLSTSTQPFTIIGGANEEPSAVVLRYNIYGNNDTNQQEVDYKNYYGIHTPLPDNKTGNFRYARMNAGIDFKNISNTELVNFENNDPTNSVSLTSLINTIAGFRTAGEFPQYSGKGFRFTKAGEVLNCITFHLKLLQACGVPVATDPFINNYLNSQGWKKIAYPDRFLEPLINVCMTQGGKANVENISYSYNGYYYNYYENNHLQDLLENFPAGAPIRQYQNAHGDTITEKQKGNMWVIGTKVGDRSNRITDNPIPTGLGVLGGAGGAGLGFLGVFGAVSVTTVAAPAVVVGGTLFGITYGAKKLINKL